ncbi:MAG: hypothetical protein AB7K09_10290 [Planctomycetota bacterium]
MPLVEHTECIHPVLPEGLLRLPERLLKVSYATGVPHDRRACLLNPEPRMPEFIPVVDPSFFSAAPSASA